MGRKRIPGPRPPPEPWGREIQNREATPLDVGGPGIEPGTFEYIAQSSQTECNHINGWGRNKCYKKALERKSVINYKTLNFYSLDQLKFSFRNILAAPWQQANER